MARLRQRNGRAVGAQKQSDLFVNLGGVPSLKRKHDTHQFEHPPSPQLLHGQSGNDSFGNGAAQIDDRQHPTTADQRVALGDKHTVEQVDRFSRRVLAGIRVVERARRRRVENQRKIGLLSEPFQHVNPTLKPEAELELRRQE